jgi:hypothetical protein
MYIFTDFVDDYVVNSSDATHLWDKYTSYSNIIMNNESESDVTDNFNFWTSDLVTLNILFDESVILNYKNYALTTLEGEYLKIAVPDLIQITYNNAVDSINSLSDPININTNLKFAMDVLHPVVISERFEAAKIDLYGIYDNYYKTIVPEEIPELEVLYQKYYSIIAGVQNEVDFAGYLSDFETICITTFTIAP